MSQIRAAQLAREYQILYWHKVQVQQAEQVYLLQLQEANRLAISAGRVARNIQLDRDKGRNIDIDC